MTNLSQAILFIFKNCVEFAKRYSFMVNLSTCVAFLIDFGKFYSIKNSTILRSFKKFYDKKFLTFLVQFSFCREIVLIFPYFQYF